MGIIDSKPAWTKGALKRLGEALVGAQPRPDGCPHYDDVMLWHNDLAAEVAVVLSLTPWRSCPPADFDIAARPKTLDTLVQKLRRENSMSLDEVQDLAGVRIDADITTDVQLALAREIATHFGDRSRVRNLLDSPHSGYRAVHVWLRLPAGRVEVQIRTVAQSAWANVYERLGDRYGRDIRYGGLPDNPAAAGLVRSMHEISRAVARSEEREAELARLTENVARLHEQISVRSVREALPMPGGLLFPRTLWRIRSQARQLRSQEASMRARIDGLREGVLATRITYLELLDDLRSRLDGEGVD